MAMSPNRARASLRSLRDDAAARFADRFHRPPAVCAAAPGRINLIGEHTDYNDGLALPLAIDRWIVAAVGPAHEHTTIALPDIGRGVQCTQHDPDAPEALRRDDSRRHAAGVIGVLRQFEALGHDVGNLNVLITGTVPVGAGLSSSAALEVAVAAALDHLAAARLDPLAMARLCQHAEHQWVGTPCGLMDMLTATCAQPGGALFMDFRSASSRPVPLPPADRCALLVVNTGVRHALADGAYARRRAECTRAAAQLGVVSLRDATRSMLNQAGLPDPLRRRVQHGIDENQRVRDAVDALEANPPRLDALGDILFAGHESLRALYEVSCPELDCIVDAARRLRQRGCVFGARLTGAGFGGCAIVLCPPDAVAEVTDNVRCEFADRFNRNPDILAVRAVGAAGIV